MADLKLRKAEMRSALRHHRLRLSSQQQHTAAQNLVDAVTELPTWSQAKTVALYLSADAEIDTRPLAHQARSLNKTLFLPVITQDKTLVFRVWHSQAELLKNQYNIPEPPPHAPECPVSDLDIVFLPLVAWDAQGGRLGMGGGFYDRSLGGINGPVRVGLAHTCQQVEAVPRQEWDVMLDYAATDTALHECRSG